MPRKLKTMLDKHLTRQFGKHDAEAFAQAPHKYAHHFDAKTLDAYIQQLLKASRWAFNCIDNGDCSYIISEYDTMRERAGLPRKYRL